MASNEFPLYPTPQQASYIVEPKRTGQSLTHQQSHPHSHNHGPSLMNQGVQNVQYRPPMRTQKSSGLLGKQKYPQQLPQPPHQPQHQPQSHGYQQRAPPPPQQYYSNANMPPQNPHSGVGSNSILHQYYQQQHSLQDQVVVTPLKTADGYYDGPHTTQNIPPIQSHQYDANSQQRYNYQEQYHHHQQQQQQPQQYQQQGRPQNSTPVQKKPPPQSYSTSPPKDSLNQTRRSSGKAETLNLVAHTVGSSKASSKQKLELELKSVFEKVDLNRSGRISPKELSNALLNFDNSKFKESTVILMIKVFTSSESSGVRSLNFDQFVQLWKYLATFKKLFVNADKDKSGDISFGELQKILEDVGYRLDVDLVLHLFQKFGNDSVGSNPTISTPNRLKFDAFIELLIYLRKLTDVFKKFDKDLSGIATISFLDFLFEVSNI